MPATARPGRRAASRDGRAEQHRRRRAGAQGGPGHSVATGADRRRLQERVLRGDPDRRPPRWRAPSPAAPARLLITLGLIVLLFAAYEVWGKAAIVNAEQNDLDQAARAAVRATRPVRPSAPARRAATARRRRAGPAVHSRGSTRTGSWCRASPRRTSGTRPGHYPNTAMPGADRQLLRRRPPQPGHLLGPRPAARSATPIVVETAQTLLRLHASPRPTWCCPPRCRWWRRCPDRPGANPTVAMLTLTTCNPKFNNYQRLDRARDSSTRRRDQCRGPPAGRRRSVADACTRGSGASCRSACRASSSARCSWCGAWSRSCGSGASRPPSRCCRSTTCNVTDDGGDPGGGPGPAGVDPSRANCRATTTSRTRPKSNAALTRSRAGDRVRVLVIDNYDSFVFNLVQYLGQLGVECEVRRNDEIARGRRRPAAARRGPALPRTGDAAARRHLHEA